MEPSKQRRGPSTRRVRARPSAETLPRVPLSPGSTRRKPEGSRKSASSVAVAGSARGAVVDPVEQHLALRVRQVFHFRFDVEPSGRHPTLFDHGGSTIDHRDVSIGQVCHPIGVRRKRKWRAVLRGLRMTTDAFLPYDRLHVAVAEPRCGSSSVRRGTGSATRCAHPALASARRNAQGVEQKQRRPARKRTRQHEPMMVL